MMLQRFVQCSEKCLKYQICHLQRAHNILTVSLQCPHNVVTASLLRSWRSYSTQEVAAVLSPHTQHPGFTQRLHSAHTSDALQDQTALCKRQAAALSLCIFQMITPHGVLGVGTEHTALLGTAQHTPRRSGIFWGCCGNTVRTPLWCDRALSWLQPLIVRL